MGPSRNEFTDVLCCCCDRFYDVEESLLSFDIVVIIFFSMLYCYIIWAELLIFLCSYCVVFVIYRVILLILLLWPLIKVWLACTVHIVGFRSLELPPTSLLTFKTVPFVISTPNKVSDGAWLCWAAQCQNIAKATNPRHVLRGVFNQNAPPLFLHRSGFMTVHFGMWLMPVTTVV